MGSPGSPSVNITPHDARWPKGNGGFRYSTNGAIILTFPNRGTTNDPWRESTGAHIITRTDPGSQDQDRFAEAYGSAVMTWSTRAVNGLIPVVGSQRPITRARWTS